MSVWTEKSPMPVATAKVTDRMTFIKKVYGLLGLSLITGIAAASMTLSNIAFLQIVAQNHLLFLIAEIGVVILCMWKRKEPTLGFVLLFAFTSLSGITAAPLIYAHQTAAFQAAVLTIVAFTGLTGYVFVTKKDFSFLSGILTVGIVLLIGGGLLNIFFFKSLDFQYLMAWAGVFIFSGFILYDTSNIIHRYNTDEYIAGALSLYLDILNLFLSLLTILRR